MPWEFDIQVGQQKCTGLKNIYDPMQELGGNYRVTTGEEPNKNSGGSFKTEKATQFFTS